MKLLSILICFIPVQLWAAYNVQPSEIIQKINQGVDVIYNNCVVAGNLDLTQVSNRVITSKIRFNRCTFNGKIIAYGSATPTKRTIPSKKVGGTISSASITSIVLKKGLTFLNQVEFIEASFMDQVDFTGANFNGTQEDSYNFKSLKFENCTFNKISIFNKISVAGRTYFSGSTFVGNTTFKEATLTQMPSFTNVLFRGSVNFTDAKLPAGAIFSSSEFRLVANFSGVMAGGNLSFNWANFLLPAYFNRASLDRFSLKSTTFNQEVYFKDMTINGVPDFENVHFLRDTSFRGTKFKGWNLPFHNINFGVTKEQSPNDYYDAKADFSNCTFEARVRIESTQFTRGVNFVGATFKSDFSYKSSSDIPMDFSGATFEGEADFSPSGTYITRFQETLDFSHANFKKSATFEGATFWRMPNFTNATFYGVTSFRDAEFQEGANFTGAYFKKNVSFRGLQQNSYYGSSANYYFNRAHFEGIANFRDANLGGILLSLSNNVISIFFEEAVFENTAVFYGMHLSGKTYFGDAHFKGPANFDKTYFTPIGMLSFDGTIFESTVTFRNAYFNAQAQYIHFENAQFQGTAPDFAGAKRQGHNYDPVN